MEEAPVTAATGALGPVVVKLGALLGREYKLRRRTQKDVRFIKSKLKSMHSILWAAWEKEVLDAESKDLKKEALDLADDMHDAVDDFILTMECSNRNKHLMIQSKIKASPFHDFRARVDEVSDRCRSKWKWEKNKRAQPISSLFSRRDVKSSTPSKPPPLPRAPFVRKDASEIFGMAGWRDDLIRYLVGGELEEPAEGMVQPQLKMASIVGMAGVGKTTLANLVYEEIGNKFQIQAFVSVTPSPNMMEVLTSILQQVGAEPLAGTQARSEEDIIDAISNSLQDKRYLVIIDDIWHRGEWDIIRRSFPENNLGSRIVITTRIASLPGDDLDNSKLCIRMNPVSRTYGTSDRRWQYGWEDLATRMKPETAGQGFDCNHPIARMCGGVPLALLCLFSAMALIREQQEQLGVNVNASDVQDMIEKQVKQCGIQNTPGFEPLVESLQIGYDNLPHHMLKTCLLHCSIYPENYHFHMNDLVMRWVAEGFTYKVDEAVGYFEELVERELLMQVNDGSTYKLNSMMQNFLRWKSQEDNFITYSSDMTSAYPCRIHRLCIDKHPGDDGSLEGVDPLSGLDWSQIRSLVVFEDAERLPFEKLARVRLLDLQFKTALGDHHVKDICGLLRVKHLFGLEGVGISELPPEIGRLHYLETLNVSNTSISKLPHEIGRLKKLKNLYVSHSPRIRELPREIGDLQHLETLCIFATDIRELPRDIGRLKKLKTLNVSYNEGFRDLPREIGDLQNLESLDLSGSKGMTSLPREIGKLQRLKTLKACWTWITELPREMGNLQNLETLDLIYSRGLTGLPREIGNLQNLEQLLLSATGVVKLPRETGRLKKLKTLKLSETIAVLPWEAGQLSELEGVPECIRKAWKNSDLVSELAGEILSIELVRWDGDPKGLIVGTKHMHIPQWIKDHFNDLGSLDIRICKLEEEQDLKILREMPKLQHLTLRLEAVPRKPIAISAEGFPRLYRLYVDSRVPPVIIFQEGAMPRLFELRFEFQFYGGPPPPANKEAQLGIKHIRYLLSVEFICSQEWYGGAEESRSPCMSAMIDVVRKEAQEHPNQISFHVSGRESELFPKKDRLAGQVSLFSSSSGSGAENEMKRPEEKKILAQEVSLSSGSAGTGPEIK